MKHTIKSISPQGIYDYISNSVEGQEQAKRAISSAMFLHFTRSMALGITGRQFKKSNALLLGPSGSGKTLIVREAIKAVSELSGYRMAPALEIDCTSLSARGWEGEHIEEMIEAHYKEHWKDEFAFKSSVIFLDEIDKMCMPAVGKGGTDHNRSTQYGLLKIVEGMELLISNGHIKVDTSNIMFVFAGNFPQIRHYRNSLDKPAMGFTDTGVKSVDIDLHKQLEAGGMITQLVGRISHIGELQALDKKQLRAILVKHILPEYIDMFDFLGYELTLSNYYIRKIVDEAADKGTGARGLQSALDRTLESDIFAMDYMCLKPEDLT